MQQSCAKPYENHTKNAVQFTIQNAVANFPIEQLVIIINCHHQSHLNNLIHFRRCHYRHDGLTSEVDALISAP